MHNVRSSSSARRLKRIKSGFTLMELLVVIGIIGVLIAILMPMLAKARRMANSTACKSNLRQIGIGVQLYCVSHRGKLPLVWERRWSESPRPDLADGGRGYHVFGLLMKFAGISMPTFRCPSDTRNYTLTESNFCVPLNSEVGDWATDRPFDYTVLLLGYGRADRRIPWSVSLTDPAIPNKGSLDFARIRRPGELMLVWDGDIPVFTYAGGASFLSGLNYLTAPPSWNWRNTFFRHSSSVDRGPNTLFADGHVDTLDWKPIFDGPSEDWFTLPH